MGCETVNDGKGGTWLICSRGRGRHRKKCEDCGERVATKQCDFPIEQERRPGPKRRRKSKTCDRFVCAACAVVQPVSVLPVAGSTAGDTRDFCRQHASVHDAGAAR